MLLNAGHLLATYGVAGIAVVLLCETGLLIGLVLPGETLTILAGAYSHGEVGGRPHPALVLVIVAATVGAVAGGALGYLLGRRIGPALLARPDGRIFRRRYVERTHEHFARFGALTIVIARFIPFVRTIASPAAGIGGMPAGRFAAFNLAGGVLWACSVATIGYLIGGLIPIDRYGLLVTLGILLLSLTPLAVHRLVRGGSGRGGNRCRSARDQTLR